MVSDVLHAQRLAAINKRIRGRPHSSDEVGLLSDRAECVSEVSEELRDGRERPDSVCLCDVAKVFCQTTTMVNGWDETGLR